MNPGIVAGRVERAFDRNWRIDSFLAAGAGQRQLGGTLQPAGGKSNFAVPKGCLYGKLVFGSREVGDERRVRTMKDFLGRAHPSEFAPVENYVSMVVRKRGI